MTIADDAKASQRDDELRAALNRALRDLERAKLRTEDLVAAVYRAVGDSLIAHPPVKVPEPKVARGKGRPEVALWHLTDWQGSKVTASYNSAIMQSRVGAFCDKAAHITDIQRTDHPVD